MPIKVDQSGGGWRARWKAPPGSKVEWPGKSGFTSRREATRYARAQEAAIEARSYIDPNLAETTVDEWWQRWFPAQDHFRPNTRESYQQCYRKHVKPRWGSVAMGVVLPIDMQEYRAELRKNLAESSVSVVMSVLRTLFDDAALNRIIPSSPFPKASRRGIKKNAELRPDRPPKREPIVFDLDTLDAICDRLRAHEALLVRIVYWTGMRWSEVAGMRRSFLHVGKGDGIVEEAGYYVIDPYIGAVHEDASSRRFFGPAKSGATGRLQPGLPSGRIIDLPPFLVALIEEHLKTLPEGQELLFANGKGDPLRYDDWNTNRWRKAVDGRPEYKPPIGRARPTLEPIILGLRLHDGKHSHGAMLDEMFIHPAMRDYRLGHATPGTRGVYSRPTVQMRIDLVNALQRAHEQHEQRNGEGPTADGPS